MYTTNNLLLVKVTPEEYDNYMRWYQDDKLMRYITGKGLTKSAADKRFQNALKANAVHPDIGFFIVKNKKDQNFMGIGKLVLDKKVRAEVGYGFLPEFWGKGLASELLEGLLKIASTIPEIETLYGIVDPQNPASAKVLTKQNFYLEKNSPYDGSMADYYFLQRPFI